LQAEVGAWSERNFGAQPVANPVLGVVEEYGELLVAEEEAATMDAIGDLIIYLADVCHRRGLDLEAAHNANSDVGLDPIPGIGAGVARLCRSVLKRRQGVRLDEDRIGDEAERQAIAEVLAALEALVADRDYGLEDCIDVAWEQEVRHRDWRTTD
ncbi:MAG: hypothetical protein ABEJ57_06605, partial [Halobacteriaceae archaeon]